MESEGDLIDIPTVNDVSNHTTITTFDVTTVIHHIFAGDYMYLAIMFQIIILSFWTMFFFLKVKSWWNQRRNSRLRQRIHERHFILRQDYLINENQVLALEQYCSWTFPHKMLSAMMEDCEEDPREFIGKPNQVKLLKPWKKKVDNLIASMAMAEVNHHDVV